MRETVNISDVVLEARPWPRGSSRTNFVSLALALMVEALALALKVQALALALALSVQALALALSVQTLTWPWPRMLLQVTI